MHIICLCTGIGFPNGMAAAKRLMLICRGLVEAGATCTVFHIGGTDFDGNEAVGSVDGVSYRYLPTTPRRPSSRLGRGIKFLMGIIRAIWLINRSARRQKVCVYACTGPHLHALKCIKPLKIIECNEWFPEEKKKHMRDKLYPFADAFVAISQPIHQNLCNQFKPHVSPFVLPILLDRKGTAISLNKKRSEAPYFFWCGSATGYGLKDVKFILDAYAQIVAKYPTVRIEFAGHFPEITVQMVKKTCTENGISEENVFIHGFVNNEELKSLIECSTALLLPLWDEIRSINRFPTKLGEYLITGRPVITAKGGEVASYCNDKNCLIYSPGDVDEFSHCLEQAFVDPDHAESIGKEGAKMAAASFDYRSYSNQLLNWIQNLYANHQVK